MPSDQHPFHTPLQIQWFNTLEAHVHQWVRERAVGATSEKDFLSRLRPIYSPYHVSRMDFSTPPTESDPPWMQDPTRQYRVVVLFEFGCSVIGVGVVTATKGGVLLDLGGPSTHPCAIPLPTKTVFRYRYPLEQYLEGVPLEEGFRFGVFRHTSSGQIYTRLNAKVPPGEPFCMSAYTMALSARA